MADDDDNEGFAARAKKEADEAVKQEKYLRRRATTLDSILRKIHRCGTLKQLTREEGAFLERTSKELADELGKEPAGWEPPPEA